MGLRVALFFGLRELLTQGALRTAPPAGESRLFMTCRWQCSALPRCCVGSERLKLARRAAKGATCSRLVLPSLFVGVLCGVVLSLVEGEPCRALSMRVLEPPNSQEPSASPLHPSPLPPAVLKVLDAVCDVLRPGGELVVLIKPQFEAGKAQVGRSRIAGPLRPPLACAQASLTF